MPAPFCVEADCALWGGRLRRGVVLTVGEDGTWCEPDSLPASVERVRLPGRVILPGLVNAHSHAFQRLIRGRTEYVAAGRSSDDFWSWREAMYRVAGTLEPEGLYAASKQAFLEMALSGMTAVGEFHYLQHAPDGTPYADRNALAKAVIRAARDVGLRIVLLRVGYARAGFRTEAHPWQRRFVDRDAEAWLAAAETLRAEVRGDWGVSVGLAPHSVRAVPVSWLEALARAPAPTRGVVHMHVAEQPAEVEACLAEHGARPVELLEGLGLLDSGFTAVHGIHLSPDEISRMGRAGSTVCACPSTERNLGDGVVS
ncbi:MAG TPA: formimidoylglutamate deiminase, partial [Myxococcaceae bacterium]|nr:formimidoylglutamate deiminase [Myxococcaceae bacterium]